MTENKLTGYLSGFLKYLLLSVAASYIVVYAAIAFFRLFYPFDLEWLEGGSVIHAARILSGQLIYVSPSLEFIPYNYTPLFFYVSAAAAFFFKVGFLPLRLVSIISSLGCFYLIFSFVKQETESRFSGFLASGLFAATFHLSGSWFDVGRPDSFFLFLLLSSLYVIRFKSSNSSSIIAGILISLAFLTKQTALPILLPVILYLLLTDWRRSIYFIITSAVIILGSTLFFDYIHNGWYIYYVFELPSNFSSRVVSSRWLTFWSEDIIPPFKIAFGMLLVYFMMFFVNPNKNTFIFYFLISVGMFGASLAPRLQAGGIENVLIPAHAMISVLFGLSFHRLLQVFRDMYSDNKHILVAFIYVLCLLQFGSGYLTYNPFNEVPSQEDMEAGIEVINILRQIDGDVFLPSHPYLVELAGKKGFAHRMQISDNLIWGNEVVRKKLSNELKNMFRGKNNNTIILGSDNEKFLPEDLYDVFEQNYILKGMISYSDEDSFKPILGLYTRPERIYVPATRDILNYKK
ncbi:MAG: glycosyltransferase family 39 protein [Nitrospirae bacterium]|nr:glycosyltransferase family 39 protein [Nitrospirota bacterium]